jgi:hypothetical protein
MKRKPTAKTFHHLLCLAHEARPQWRPDRAWRDAVLSDADRMRPLDADLDRLAPRFALAAAALSAVCLLAAAWGLEDLSARILTALTSQALHFGAPGLGI